MYVAFTTSTIASIPTQDYTFSQVSDFFRFDRSCCCCCCFLLIIIILRKFSGKSLTHNHLPLYYFKWTLGMNCTRSMVVIIYKLFSHLPKRCGTFSIRNKYCSYISLQNLDMKLFCSQCCEVSISSTLNAQIFRTKVLSAAFSSYVLALTNIQKHIRT